MDPNVCCSFSVLWDRIKSLSSKEKNENSENDACMSLFNSFLSEAKALLPHLIPYNVVGNFPFVHRVSESCYEILHGVNLSASRFKKSYLPRLIVQFANKDVHLSEK